MSDAIIARVDFNIRTIFRLLDVLICFEMINNKIKVKCVRMNLLQHIINYYQAKINSHTIVLYYSTPCMLMQTTICPTARNS